MFFLGLVALMLVGPSGFAQQNVHASVLSEHTWYKLSVAHEGVYKLDYEALQRMGVDMDALNPNQIRLFGNPSGVLPEKNSEPRPDDLTEMAIYVGGADDGSFDAEDYVLFYGQEPTRWNLVGSEGEFHYERERNPYSDTTYYFLCTDSGTEGLRISEKASLLVDGATTVITEFPDFWWHDEELFSPYSQGRTWFGESIMASDPELSLLVPFPHLVKSKALRVKMSVMGRCKEGKLIYDIRIDDNLLVSNGKIDSCTDHIYGRVAETERMFLLDNDTATFRLQYVAGASGSLLYLDYLEVYGWRQLIREGAFFPFRMFPSQFGMDRSAVWVQNVSSDFWLWDVSNPLAPQRQAGVLSGGNFVFAVDEARERRYAMFDPSAASEVASWTPVPNQNLHAASVNEMLIITAPEFLEQANELAAFHEQRDGLRCFVANVKEIYNEFSTGTPDPSGVRDFIRMVYFRNPGGLKFVTLFGRASFDYRNLKGFDRNFVPCYEDQDSKTDMSNGTDDFFGLMDAHEGLNCTGRVDIGIGRFPVSTTEEAEAVLNKIRLYYDRAATHGDWKTDMLLLSDDEVKDYVNHNETYVSMMDTICPSLNMKKVYCGAYPRNNTASGVSIPQANADLMRMLNDGVFMLCYTGHGGVRGLTGDNVFTVSDINALNNHERMPFVFTATCEFSKYEDPLLVSAGEQLFLKADGGAIAMMTTTRPTTGTNNAIIGKAMMNVLMRRGENGELQYMGDIVKMAKNHQSNFNSSNVNRNINFVYFGDPALRLAFPEEDVVSLRINGEDVNIEGIQLNAMSMVTLEGEIRMADGNLDQAFNGELWVRLYDKKTPFEVQFKNYNGSIYYATYSHHRDMVYRGRVSVNEGRFSLSFQVPKDINLDYGSPRFEFYAYDSIREKEAIGKYDNLVLGGVDPTATVDNEGPQIDFYWNAPTFADGDVVEDHGVLYADLYDPQGIYHYDFSLGRNIVMNSNLSSFNNLILNDRFEPALDDYQRGRIAIPVSDLASGMYEFSLKAWDTQNNSSEATLWFVVEGQNSLFLSQVWNYPNPFSEETYFTMAHIGEDGDYRVDLEIFDVMGRNVARFSQMVTSTNNVIAPIQWKANDMFGRPLRSGVYLYRLTFTDENGYSRTVSQKMMVNR